MSKIRRVWDSPWRGGDHITGDDRTHQPTEKPPDCENILGPRLVTLRTRTAAARATGAGLAAAGVVLLMVAASLTPPTAGFGAHEQLGLAPCSFPLLLGLPCPTCGMTTAFAYFAQGHPLASFHAQPAGFVLAVSVAAAVVAGLFFLLTGRRWAINWYRVSPARAATIVGGILLFGWVYKIATVLLARV